ncbi:MAG: hypothetical protein KDD69_00390 [Bdellovibrionales bacterium]|nr:hypothetical protein [Bdellovibrionales bacterium]
MAISQSSGSMIGAILESVGYHYQSAVLDSLSAPFENELGGLIYLVGVALAVGAAATQGGYKLGVWLLIGPPLFFSVIQPRDQMPNAQWAFGKEGRDATEVNAQVRNLTAQSTAGGGQANVSKVFKRYVEMISATNSEIVSLMARNRNKADLWFVVRAELFGLLHTGQVEDPGLKRLLHYSLLGECQKAIDAGRTIDDVVFRQRQNAQQHLIESTQAGRESRQFQQADRQWAQANFERYFRKDTFNLDAEAAVFVLGLTTPEATAEQIAEKVPELMQEGVTCEQIWNWVLRGLGQYASIQLEHILREGENLGIARDRMAGFLGQVTGTTADGSVAYGDGAPIGSNELEALTRLVAKFYLRNEWRNRDKSAWLARFVTRIDSRRLETDFKQQNAFTEQARLGASEWGEKERMIHAAGSLPYYQGLLLYFLGATFPFFALLLLIPGKQAGFILWFLLWIWVKSWDIGMAVVMLLDDLIFAMLATEMSTVGRTESTPLNEDLSFAFATLAEMDPTFQLAMYYTIIGVSVLAIPMTSAQIVLGGARAGASLVSDGASKVSEFFADAVTANVEQQAITSLRSEARDLKMLRARQFASNLAQGNVPFKGTGINPNNELISKNMGRVIPGTQASGLNRQPQNASAAGEAKATEQGRAVGEASGFSGAPHVTGHKSNALVAAFAKAFTAEDRKATAAHVAGALDTMKQERLTAAAQAGWYADIEQSAAEIYERIAIYRGIPIPWSNFAEESADDEMELAMKRYGYNESQRAADWAVLREVYESFLGIANSVARDMKAHGAEGGQLTAEEIRKLPADVRAEIGKRYSEYLDYRGSLMTGPIAGAASGAAVLATDQMMGNTAIGSPPPWSSEQLDLMYGTASKFTNHGMITFGDDHEAGEARAENQGRNSRLPTTTGR